MTQITLGELLRRHRLEADLTQKQVADLIGYDHSVISRVERSTLAASKDLLDRFIAALALPTAQSAELLQVYEQGLPAARQAVAVLASIAELRPRADWGEAPDVGAFYGRQGEMVGLRHWVLADRCRLIGIFGMGGIGKTALATTLAQAVVPEFDCVLWRSLRNAPPLEDLLRECVAFFSDQQVQIVPGHLDRSISLLLETLAARRCLLVLDNLETLLRSGDHAGQYRDGYAGYSQLIRRIGETAHISCVIVTSREKPREVALLEGNKASVRSFALGGLGADEGRALLTDKGVVKPSARWADVVAAYAGNPLALRIVAEAISAVFDGDIARFLAHGAMTIGDIRDLLDQQFVRLSRVEQDLMYWLAIQREPTATERLLELFIGPLARRDVPEALLSLRRRSLIEQSAAGFTLQNVVMEYMTDRLVDEAAAELLAGTPARLISHPLIMADAREYVRESQVRVILDPLIERLRAELGDQEIDMRVRALLESLRRSHSRQPGYAGGSALNLLVRLHGELRGYDFSGIAVRQAHLRGVEVHDVSFAQADLAQSTFTETFGSIFSAAVSPDGRLAAFGTQTGEIRIYRLADNQLVGICQGHENLIWTLDFSPDGALLASGCYDHTIRLWEVGTWRCRAVLREHIEIVRTVAFSSDGRTLVSACEDQTIRLWDIASGECRQVLMGLIWWSAAAISPDGRTIAAASYDRNIHLWDIEAQRWSGILEGHTDVIWSLAFSPDGQVLASSSHDQTGRLWSMADGACISVLRGHTDAISKVTFSPAGHTLATGGDDHMIRLWDAASGECIRVLQGHSDWVPGLAFTPDSATLVSGSRDQTARLWDAAAGQCVSVLQGHTNMVWSAAFSPDSAYLASGHHDHTLRCWSMADRRCVATLRGHTNLVRSTAYSPDGQLIASADYDGSARLWETSSGRCMHILQGHDNALAWVAFSPDGRILATGGRDYKIVLWDVATGQLLKTLHEAITTSDDTMIEFSPDGQLIAQCAVDGCVWLWDVQSGARRILAAHDGTPLAVAFSPDGKLIVSGGTDNQILLWETATGTRLHTFVDHTDWLLSLCFSPNGNTLASASADHTVRLWDVERRECIAVLQGHTDWVREVAFSPDGRTIASAGADETIRLWDRATLTCVAVLRLEPPYAGMNIAGATGLAGGQRAALKALGALEA